MFPDTRGLSTDEPRSSSNHPDFFRPRKPGNPATYIDLLKTHRIHGTGIFSYIYHENTIHASKYAIFMDGMGNGWDKSKHIFLNVYCNLAHPQKKGQTARRKQNPRNSENRAGLENYYAFDLAWHLEENDVFGFEKRNSSFKFQTVEQLTFVDKMTSAFPTKSCCFTYAIGFNSFLGICSKHKMQNGYHWPSEKQWNSTPLDLYHLPPLKSIVIIKIIMIYGSLLIPWSWKMMLKIISFKNLQVS